MSIRPLHTLTLATAMAVGMAASAEAQRSTTRGFNVGLHLEGASLSVEGETPDDGGGGGLHLGYGFNRIVTMFLDLSASAIDLRNPTALTGRWELAHVDLGVRAHLANASSRFVPYIEGAVGGRDVSARLTDGGETRDVTFSGGTFTMGFGLNMYLQRTWALDANMRFSSGEFSKIGVGDVSISGQDLDASSARFKLGVIWWT